MSAIDISQIAHVDTVDLKCAVPEGELGAMMDAVGLDLLESEVRQVYYFDTPQLALLSQGVVLRARRLQRGRCDTAAKLRPLMPAELPKKWRASPDLAIEADVAPGTSVCTGAIKRAISRPRRLQETLGGKRPTKKLFSNSQRALLSECGTADIDWPSLRPHGPVGVLRVRGVARRLGLRLVIELWRYPDGSSLLELSTRVRPNDLHDASGRLWTLVRGLGVDVAAEQETKAARTLSFFAHSDSPRARVGQPARNAVS